VIWAAKFPVIDSVLFIVMVVLALVGSLMSALPVQLTK
jgi:hypothetical protein